MQFDHKLQSLYLEDVDIGTENHSKEFIRGYVESTIGVMVRRIS